MRRRRPVLVPNSCAALDEQVADRVALEQLGRERPAADARRVRLHDADDALDRARPDAGAGAHAARDRVARRDERIRAVVEVEERRLRAFEQHPLLRVERFVHEVHGVVDHRREARHHARGTARRSPSASIGRRL